jgi:electron transport complex protein RnfG
MWDKIKPAVSLFIISLAAALALGFVYEITLEPIKRQKEKIEAETVAALIPGTSETIAENVSTAEGSTVTKAVACLNAGEIIGYAVTAAPKGYGGELQLMVGFDTRGVIQGVRILSHSETPGLGANAALPAFTDQYKNKTGRLSVVKIKGNEQPHEVVAVTSATITSDAVTRGVNDAVDCFENNWRAGE